MDETKFAYTNVEVFISGKNASKTFPSIKDAQAFCAENPGTRINFLKLSSRTWRQREHARKTNGVYDELPIPFLLLLNKMRAETDTIDNHFPHLSEDKTAVAYTPSHDYGVLDRQVVIAPGRYLKKYFSRYLSDAKIQEAANEFKVADMANLVLKFGMSQEDFKFAYSNQKLNSPSSIYLSCMAGQFRELKHHPAEAYAAGDLSIAYLFDQTTPEIVLARSVCYPEKKRHSHIYAASHKYEVILHDRLKKEGYKKNTNFSGAKILRIPFKDPHYEHSYIVPYIDGGMRVANIEGNRKEFILDNNDGRGRLADSTSGVLYV